MIKKKLEECKLFLWKSRGEEVSARGKEGGVEDKYALAGEVDGEFDRVD